MVSLDEGTEDSKASSRAMIEEEIRELHKAKSDYLQTIDELQAQPSCPPRRFEFGEIRKERETTMRCAFCDAIGEHYSDSCYEVQSAEERRHLITAIGDALCA
ncbi:toxin-antitoxin system, antitoxin component, ribbon-helix-helix domain protein [Cooperia oncophora]